MIWFSTDNLPYEKVGKNEPVCIADEVPFEIPETWEWVHLSDIAISGLGKTLNKSIDNGKDTPYLPNFEEFQTAMHHQYIPLYRPTSHNENFTNQRVKVLSVQ